MTAAQTLDLKRRLTVEEYLAFDQQSEEKYDLVDGFLEPVFPVVEGMAGGTVEQAGLNANVIRQVGNAIDGKPCRVFDSNLKVRIGHKKKYRYPDATVICGDPEFDPDDQRRTTALNPILIIEVVSDSSVYRDRFTKFIEYREIESFREYVLVSQKVPLVEAYFKQDNGTWLFTPIHGLEGIVALRSIGVDLKMGDIFAGIEFPAPPADESDVAAQK